MKFLLHCRMAKYYQNIWAIMRSKSQYQEPDEHSDRLQEEIQALDMHLKILQVSSEQNQYDDLDNLNELLFDDCPALSSCDTSDVDSDVEIEQPDEFEGLVADDMEIEERDRHLETEREEVQAEMFIHKPRPVLVTFDKDGEITEVHQPPDEEDDDTVSEVTTEPIVLEPEEEARIMNDALLIQDATFRMSGRIELPISTCVNCNALERDLSLFDVSDCVYARRCGRDECRVCEEKWYVCGSCLRYWLGYYPSEDVSAEFGSILEA